MQNWTVELTGTNREDVQNTNEQMRKSNVHPGLLNTTVKIQFLVLEVYQMLAAKRSVDVPEHKAEVQSVGILYASLLGAG